MLIKVENEEWTMNILDQKYIKSCRALKKKCNKYKSSISSPFVHSIEWSLCDGLAVVLCFAKLALNNS